MWTRVRSRRPLRWGIVGDRLQPIPDRLSRLSRWLSVGGMAQGVAMGSFHPMAVGNRPRHQPVWWGMTVRKSDPYWAAIADGNPGLGITTPYAPGSYTSRGLIEWMAAGTVSRGVARITVRQALEIAAIGCYDTVQTINFLDEIPPMEAVPL